MLVKKPPWKFTKLNYGSGGYLLTINNFKIGKLGAKLHTTHSVQLVSRSELRTQINKHGRQAQTKYRTTESPYIKWLALKNDHTPWRAF